MVSDVLGVAKSDTVYVDSLNQFLSTPALSSIRSARSSRRSIEIRARMGLKLNIVHSVGDAVVLDPLRAHLLETVERTGSITAAARRLQISYAHAWRLIQDLTARIGEPVIDSGSRGSRLASTGREVLSLYRAMEQGATAVSASSLARLRKLTALR